jgi:hypothetical protein
MSDLNARTEILSSLLSGEVPSVMRISQLWHIGVGVQNLDEALADFERSSDIGFNSPVTVRIGVRMGADIAVPREIEIRTAMSLGSPPSLELVEAIPGTVYSDRMLHVAFWADDLGRCARELPASGCPMLLADAHGPSGLPAIMSYHRAPSGLVVEAVNGNLKDAVYQHMAGGVPPIF